MHFIALEEPLTIQARHPSQVPVQLDDVASARPLMQAVDVLRDDAREGPTSLKSRDRPM